MEPLAQQSPLSDAIRKHKEFLFPAVATYYQEPIALVKGEGEYVWDDQGNRYLDCFGGVLTVNRQAQIMKYKRMIMQGATWTEAPATFRTFFPADAATA